MSWFDAIRFFCASAIVDADCEKRKKRTNQFKKCIFWTELKRREKIIA